MILGKRPMIADFAAVSAADTLIVREEERAVWEAERARLEAEEEARLVRQIRRLKMMPISVHKAMWAQGELNNAT
jgi:hypothetical protein